MVRCVAPLELLLTRRCSNIPARTRLRVRVRTEGLSCNISCYHSPSTLEPQCPPCRRRVPAHQGFGEVGLALLDRIDDRMMLAMTGHQDRIDFVERDAFRGNDARGDEWYPVDAVDELAEQGI